MISTFIGDVGMGPKMCDEVTKCLNFCSGRAAMYGQHENWIDQLVSSVMLNALFNIAQDTLLRAIIII